MPPLTSTQIHFRPPAALVAAVRERHGLTQLQCAAVVDCTDRAWRGFESIDRKMHRSTWWLFLLRIKEIDESQLLPIPPRQRAGAMVYLKPA